MIDFHLEAKTRFLQQEWMLSIFITTRQNSNKFDFALSVPKIRVKKEKPFREIVVSLQHRIIKRKDAT